MKISNVIKKLQEIQKEHGDLEVVAYYDPWTEGYNEPLTDEHIRFNSEDNSVYIGG